MNYYPHHIGDYTRDTAHLSMIEDGAYRRMMDLYYASEKPLTLDRAALYRLLRARDKDEREAVDVVLVEFFTECPDGWHQTRCNAEVARMQEKSDKAKASAAKRWQGEPDANASANGNANASANASPNAGANAMLPIANNQEPIAKETVVRLAPDPIPYTGIVDAYHASMTGLAKVREVTKKRKGLMRNAWQEIPTRRSLEFWKAYFEECADDAFLNGTGPYRPPHENWRPSFDYLLRSDTVTKVYEKAMDRLDREKVA